MDVLGHVAAGFASALTPTNLFMAFAGSLLGTLVGVLPGLGPTVALAILFPLSLRYGFGLGFLANMLPKHRSHGADWRGADA